MLLITTSVKPDKSESQSQTDEHNLQTKNYWLLPNCDEKRKKEEIKKKQVGSGRYISVHVLRFL